MKAHIAVLAISLMLLASIRGFGGQQSAGAQQPSIKLPPALARVLTDYEKAWRSRDAAGLARLFADHGFVLPNGRPPVRGRAACTPCFRLRDGWPRGLHHWRVCPAGRRSRYR